MVTKRKSRNFLVIALFLQFTTCALMLLDVPVARQVIGFVYFTTVPGFIIVKLLKLNELDRLEIVLFSAGLSIAFLMLAGLITNEFCFLIGISEPLSLAKLLIVLNTFILVGGLLAFLRGGNIKFWETKTLGSSFIVLLLTVLPILSVIGAIWVNAFGNNLILLLMIIAIALLFVVGVISKKALPPKLYPLAVLMIAISLLFHSSLISKYVVTYGSDVAIEYFVFRSVQNNAYWSPISMYPSMEYSRMNSMLSVTILPAIFSSLLNMNATQVLKILYPLIYSIMPLALYQLWQKNFGKKRAFAAAFLLMAQATFFTEMIGLTRQMIAELFFILLLLVMLNKKMKPPNKMMCFMIFGVAFVVSHYSLAVIFLFFISIACIHSALMKHERANVTMVVFFFVVMFAWYIYTSGSAVFDSILSYGDYIYKQLDQFFTPASRGETVLLGLGMENPPSILNAFSRVFAYLTEFFIAFGSLGLIMRRMDIRLEREHFTFTVTAVAFLVALIVVPGLASTMNMTRFYHILLLFLAPLFVLGVEFFLKLLSKREKEIRVSVLLLIVLTPYFLFQTSFVYEVTRSESWSVALSSYRMGRNQLYLIWGHSDDLGVFAAEWLRTNVHTQNTQVYADFSLTHTLIAYGHLYGGDILMLSNVTKVPVNGIVFLSPLNVIDKKIVTYSYLFTLDQLHFLDEMNKIYTNGGGEIYRNPIENQTTF